MTTTAPPPDPWDPASLQRTALAIVWDVRDKRDPRMVREHLALACSEDPQRMAAVLWILAAWADQSVTPPATRRLLR